MPSSLHENDQQPLSGVEQAPTSATVSYSQVEELLQLYDNDYENSDDETSTSRWSDELKSSNSKGQTPQREAVNSCKTLPQSNNNDCSSFKENHDDDDNDSFYSANSASLRDESEATSGMRCTPQSPTDRFGNDSKLSVNQDPLQPVLSELSVDQAESTYQELIKAKIIVESPKTPEIPQKVQVNPLAASPSSTTSRFGILHSKHSHSRSDSLTASDHIRNGNASIGWEGEGSDAFAAITFSQEIGASNRIGHIKARWKDSGSQNLKTTTTTATQSSRQLIASNNNSDDDQDNSESGDKSKSSRRGNNSDGRVKRAPPIQDRRAVMRDRRQVSNRRLSALLAFKEAAKSVKGDMTSKEAFNFKQVVRKARKVDLETGAKRTREFTAQRVSDPEYFDAMNPLERRKNMFVRKSKESLTNELDSSTSQKMRRRNHNFWSKRNITKETEEASVQYRLHSMIEKGDNGLINNDSFNLIREYLYWCFRTSFIFVLFTESMFFLLWCLGFAILYYLLGKLNPQCIIGPGGLDFEEGDMTLVDTFTLSWTTFSTVGYGNIHPAIHGHGTSTKCVFITLLTSLQSFIGVLTASFCSAIIFSKIAKSQSVAHIIFSKTFVIRFGEELMQKRSTEDSSERNDDVTKGFQNRESTTKADKVRRKSKRQSELYPCPILEFRVVNLLHSAKGGEIMNCKLNVVASTLEEVSKVDTGEKPASVLESVLPAKQAVESSMKMLHQTIKEKSLKSVRSLDQAAKTGYQKSVRTLDIAAKTGGSLVQKVNKSLSDFTSQQTVMQAAFFSGSTNGHSETEAAPYKEDESVASLDVNMLDGSNATLKSSGRGKGYQSSNKFGQSLIFVDEEPGCDDDEVVKSRRVFSKLELETDSHPFFKRVWNIRHVLNMDSPLLGEEIQEVIRRHGGLWPASICNAEFIRSCIDMNQLIVTLSGTAVVSGSSVYKLHVYEADCLEVGKTFENALAVDRDDKITVDMNLVHSTVPQFTNEEGETDGEEGTDSSLRDQGFAGRFDPRRLAKRTR